MSLRTFSNLSWPLSSTPKYVLEVVCRANARPLFQGPVISIVIATYPTFQGRSFPPDKWCRQIAFDSTSIAILGLGVDLGSCPDKESIPRSLAHIAIIVRDHDKTITSFTGVLGFFLVADEYQPSRTGNTILDSPRLPRPSPLAPFARAAAALAGEVARPARAAIHFAVPNTPLTRPGTV